MFSGFRNVVENLAQPQPRPSRPQRSESQDLSSERLEHSRASGSFDLSNVAHSTGYLAESAFSNLRKSLAAQRPFTVTSPVADSSARASPQPDRELKPVSKLTLEDRLRASFAIGDASTSPSPGPSHAPTPKPPPSLTDSALSPRSLPLPDSPVQIGSLDEAVLPHPLADPPKLELTEHKEEGPPLPPAADGVEPAPPLDSVTIPSTENSNTGEPSTHEHGRYPEADIPLPLQSPMPSNLAASQSTPSLQLEESTWQNDELENHTSRLDSLERMYSETSKTLEEMRAAQAAINSVLADFTPVASLLDVEGLREHLQSLQLIKTQSQAEIKRLNNRLRNYDERIEELRDTHRLESRSQTELVDSLRKQLEESESLLGAAQSSAAQAEKDAQQHKEELNQVRGEVQKMKDTVKDEEEKRTKAISLLKTVRQKLVKAEKDRDDTIKELGLLKEQVVAEKERGSSERAKLEKEIENVRAEKERDISGLRAHFDRELASMREKLDKDFAARKAQLDYANSSMKAAYQKEVAARDTKIQTLENAVRSLNSERDSLFDQLQMRQAELESSRSHLETLQSSTSEYQFQLREATDRSALLIEELADARRELEYRDLKPIVSSNDASTIRAAIETKYESKIAELSSRLADVERDRNDMEAALSRSLQQKSQEIESLRKQVATSAQLKTKGYSQEEVQKSKQEIESLQYQLQAYKEELSNLEYERTKVNELEAKLQLQANESKAREEQRERELAGIREREAHLRGMNKTLRDDLRKVQNSAALLEKQRNPGVGFWSTARNGSTSETRISSPSASAVELPSPSRTGTPVSNKNEEEEVNLEYLRNVILQFLEHKDMRPHLVRVLSIILHFTPQETRRLVAKAGA